VNHQLSIANIVRVLDEEYGRVVAIVIEHRFLYDRRKMGREAVRQPVQANRFALV
jgi:hypothetical protein